MVNHGIYSPCRFRKPIVMLPLRWFHFLVACGGSCKNFFRFLKGVFFCMSNLALDSAIFFFSNGILFNIISETRRSASGHGAFGSRTTFSVSFEVFLPNTRFGACLWKPWVHSSSISTRLPPGIKRTKCGTVMPKSHASREQLFKDASIGEEVWIASGSVVTARRSFSSSKSHLLAFVIRVRQRRYGSNNRRLRLLCAKKRWTHEQYRRLLERYLVVRRIWLLEIGKIRRRAKWRGGKI